MIDASMLSSKQKKYLTELCGILTCNNNKQPIVSLNAPAGTGKSMTTRLVTQALSKAGIKSCVLAYTGRAASNMQSDGLMARTCHSLLYKPLVDENGDLIRFEDREDNEILQEAGSVIFVDEASFLPPDMHERLVSLGIPIVYSGDDEQLPAITPGRKEEFCVLNEPFITHKFSFDEYFRQKEGSRLLDLCISLRTDESIPKQRNSEIKTIMRGKAFQSGFYSRNEFDIAICGTNKTRQSLNNMVRTEKGFNHETAMKGERIMCLQNNKMQGGSVNNGELFDVVEVWPNNAYSNKYFVRNIDTGYEMWLVIDHTCWTSEKPDPRNRREAKQNNFTFGYATTAHKVQGSSFNRVLFIDENVSFFLDQRKFRYTACSRAREFLVVAQGRA